jgi:hypothetical protein
MISESLYDIAFQFKKAKLWNKMYDSQLFAVAHSDGMIGYCCAMGMMGEHLALAVYPGAAGMDSYRMMGKDRDEMSELETMETALSQNCVMLSFENKEELRPRELAEVRAYCAARGLSLRGRKAFPQFQRFRPHYFPWYVTDEADQTHLYEALEAGLEVSAKLDETVPADLGFTEGPPFHRTIPLLRKENSGFAWETVPLPEPLPVVYPSAVLRDDIALAKLAKSKKRGGEWACDVFMHVDPMSAEEGADGMVVEPEDAPFYPYLLLIVDNKDGMVLGAQLSEEPEDYTEKFAQAILEVAQKAGKLHGFWCTTTGPMRCLRRRPRNWARNWRGKRIFPIWKKPNRDSLNTLKATKTHSTTKWSSSWKGCATRNCFPGCRTPS